MPSRNHLHGRKSAKALCAALGAICQPDDADALRAAVEKGIEQGPGVGHFDLRNVPLLGTGARPSAGVVLEGVC